MNEPPPLLWALTLGIVAGICTLAAAVAIGTLGMLMGVL